MKLKVLQADREDVYRDMARVPENYRQDEGGQTITEGEVCSISVQGRKAFVIVRGLQGEQGQVIKLDDRTRSKLALSLGDEQEVELKKVGLIGQFRWAWEASDPAYRVAARLALLSVVLGVIGAFLGICSIAGPIVGICSTLAVLLAMWFIL